MFGKAQQPMASHARQSGRPAACEQKPRATAALSALGMSFAVLVLAAPANAAGPVSGLLDTVAKTAAPAVAQAVAPAPQVAPSPFPSPARRADDAAPSTAAAVKQTADRAASPSGSAGGDRAGASAQHGQDSSSGASATQHAPGDRSESATRRDESSHSSSATPPHDASSTSSPGSTVPAAPGHSSSPIGRLLTYGAAPVTKRTTADVRRTLVKRPAGTGERGLLSAQTPRTAGGVLAHTVRQPALAPAVLGEASRAIGNVGETATRLAGSTPVAIVPLPASLQPSSLTLPSPTLPWLPVLLAVPVRPVLPAVPALPALPALPIFTLAPQQLPLQAQPTGLWPPIAVTSGTFERSPAAAQQGAAPVSTAPASGWPGAAAMTSASEQTAAPQGRTSAGVAPAGTPAAGEVTPSAPSMAATTGYPYASATAASAAPLAARPARAPAPSPGGISAATGAVAGTSIPIFLTLAGLLLLATPRVRRVLRLLGESWRLSPLALIPERPG